MDTVIENVIEWVKGQSTATITAPNKSRLMSMVSAAKERMPEDVEITENADGSIVAHVPAAWVKIRVPRQLTDDQKAALASKLSAMKKSNSASGKSDE